MAFLGNTACPKCRKNGKDRKGDNLAQYSDGGFYCWSCGYRGGGKAIRPVEAPEESIEPKYSWSSVIPLPHVQKLTSMGFKPSEIGLFKYDYYWDRRIYPVYSGKTLVFYEARSLSKQPKSIQKGEKPFHVLGDNGMLVIVEDILSAIKVARYARSLCVWGSTLQQAMIPQIIALNTPVAVWLDADKYRKALQIARSLGLVGVDVQVITTELDPKDLDEAQILEKL